MLFVCLFGVFFSSFSFEFVMKYVLESTLFFRLGVFWEQEMENIPKLCSFVCFFLFKGLVYKMYLHMGTKTVMYNTCITAMHLGYASTATVKWHFCTIIYVPISPDIEVVFSAFPFKPLWNSVHWTTMQRCNASNLVIASVSFICLSCCIWLGLSYHKTR